LAWFVDLLVPVEVPNPDVRLTFDLITKDERAFGEHSEKTLRINVGVVGEHLGPDQERVPAQPALVVSEVEEANEEQPGVSRKLGDLFVRPELWLDSPDARNQPCDLFSMVMS